VKTLLSLVNKSQLVEMFTAKLPSPFRRRGDLSFLAANKEVPYRGLRLNTLAENAVYNCRLA